MLIARSPLRITFGGGGTDLPSYYRQHGGYLIAAAIDRYVYVSVTRPFKKGIFLKYSSMEEVATVAEVRHPIIREALAMLELRTPQIEITTMADIPAGTGLGSSGSFTTALLKALYAHRRSLLLPGELARLACEIEIDRLHEPVGKQDQYIAAYGGLTCFEFHPDESVRAEPLNLSPDTLYELEDRLLLFFTGFSRSAGSILKDQDSKSRDSDPNMIANLHQVKELGIRTAETLRNGDIESFGALLDEQWTQKKLRSPGTTRPEIDDWYALGRRNGAIGGKLVGAGGGGFLLFCADDRTRLRRAMRSAGLDEIRFKFDFEGTKNLLS